MEQTAFIVGKIPPAPLTKGYLEVGGDIIDCGALRLLNRETSTRLTPKAFGVLHALAQRQGETLSREALLDAVWTETTPTPDVVKQAILELRRVFEPDEDSPSVIQTIPRLGYRLLAPCRYSETWPFPSDAVLRTVPAASAEPAILDRVEPAPTNPVRTFRGHWAGMSVAVLAAALAAGVMYWRSGSSSSDKPLSFSPPLSYQLLSSELGQETLPSVSPDGSRIAYVTLDATRERSRIWLQTTDGLGRAEFDALHPQAFEDYPVWLPEGAGLIFLRRESGACGLFLKSVMIGPERLLAGCRSRGRQYFDLSPDGREMILSRPIGSDVEEGRLVVQALADGSRHFERYARSGPMPDVEPKYSPDGSRVAFRRGLQPTNDLFVFDRAKNELRQLTRFGASLRGYAWSPSGHWLIVSSNHLGSFALYALRVADGALWPLGIEDAEYPSIARRASVLAFTKTRIVRGISRLPLSVGGSAAAQAFAQSTGSEFGTAISPDGASIAFVSNRSGSDQVWLQAGDDVPAYQVSRFADERLSALGWAPDSQRLLVVAARGTQARLYELNVQRQVLSALTPPGLAVRQAVYDRNGRDLWLVGRDNEGAWMLWRGLGSADHRYRFLPTRHPAEAVQTDAGSGDLFLLAAQSRSIDRVNADLRSVERLDFADPVLYYRVRAGSLWYTSFSPAGTRIERRRLADGAVSVLSRTLLVERSFAAFDVSPDGSYATVTEKLRDDSDIAVARLPESFR